MFTKFSIQEANFNSDSLCTGKDILPSMMKSDQLYVILFQNFFVGFIFTNNEKDTVTFVDDLYVNNNGIYPAKVSLNFPYSTFLKGIEGNSFRNLTSLFSLCPDVKKVYTSIDSKALADLAKEKIIDGYFTIHTQDYEDVEFNIGFKLKESSSSHFIKECTSDEEEIDY